MSPLDVGELTFPSGLGLGGIYITSFSAGTLETVESDAFRLCPLICRVIVLLSI